MKPKTLSARGLFHESFLLRHFKRPRHLEMLKPRGGAHWFI